MMFRQLFGFKKMATVEPVATEKPVSTAPPSRLDHLGQGEDPKVGLADAKFSPSEWLSVGLQDTVPADLLHPGKEGLEPVSARDLMNANRVLIEQALDSFINKAFIADFDAQLLELVRRVAHWMGPFPASRGHHHAGRGGLFTHSIGVAVSALHMSITKNLVTQSSPRDRDADILAWQLVCFVAGLLHDIGKLNTTGRIFALAVQPPKAEQAPFRSSAAPAYFRPWEPMVEGFEGWASAHSVKSYFIDFEYKEVLAHKEFTIRYVMALVPRPILAFIYNSNEMVRQQFEDFIRNPESTSQTPIFQIVQDADHINVAQSVDPRRKPGVEEWSGLVMRRFAEYAAEATWNLPTSPFIYAHVEKKTEDGIRYFGVPFFVATEQSIDGFIDYIKSRPLLGVTFGDRVREMVFGSLTDTHIMSPTIEGILTEQLRVKGLDEAIPASEATVRFKASVSARAIKPIDGSMDDRLVTLPVIPIKVRVPSSNAFSAPTLSFFRTPSAEASAVIPVAIDNGKVAPADPTLLNDPAFMANMHFELSQKDMTEVEAAVFKSLPKAHGRKPKKANDDTKAVAKPRAMTESGREGELASLPTAKPETADAPTSAKEHLLHPAGTPAWLRCYIDASAKIENQSPQAIWAVAWLYIADHPVDLVRVQVDGKGGYLLRTTGIPKKLREELVGKLTAANVSVALLARHWKNSRIDVKDPDMAGVFATSSSPREAHTVKLHQITCDLIDQYKQYLKEGTLGQEHDV